MKAFVEPKLFVECLQVEDVISASINGGNEFEGSEGEGNDDT